MPVRGARRVAGVACGARASEAEVLQRLLALTIEERRTVMRFDDVVLVERVRSALQVLFERQTVMDELCANMGYGGREDAFESSVLLKQAFEFTYGIGRLASDPSVSCHMTPVMVMKAAFLQEPRCLCDTMKRVLPEFLSAKAPRAVLPRARWKDLWATEPASITVMEQQLAKLVEQALWAMAAEPPLTSQPAVKESAALEFEPWMAEHDQEVAKAREVTPKKKKKKNKQKPQPTTLLEPIEDDTQLDTDEDDEESTVRLDAEETMAGEVPPDCDDVVMQGSYLSLPLPEHRPSLDAGEDVSAIEASLDNLDACSTLELPRCVLRPPRTPPSSPLGGSRTWMPTQLVNYLWGQTSQLTSPRGAFCEAQRVGADKDAPDGADKEGPLWGSETPGAVSTKTPTTPISRTTSAQGTPLHRGQHRGQWRPFEPQVAPAGATRVVVRNTFIDLDVSDAGSRSGQRSSRSLSPSYCTPTNRGDRTPISGRHAPVSYGLPEKNVGGDQSEWSWYWH